LEQTTVEEQPEMEAVEAAHFSGLGGCAYDAKSGTGAYAIHTMFYDYRGCEMPMRVGTSALGYAHIKLKRGPAEQNLVGSIYSVHQCAFSFPNAMPILGSRSVLGLGVSA
jgi:hypothetical protein